VLVKFRMMQLVPSLNDMNCVCLLFNIVCLYFQILKTQDASWQEQEEAVFKKTCSFE